MDLWTFTQCFGCGKNVLVKDAVMGGTDLNHMYLCCAFCGQYGIQSDGSFNWSLVVAQYAAIAAEAINPDDLAYPNSDSLGYPWV
jgi:hypothetical protein